MNTIRNGFATAIVMILIGAALWAVVLAIVYAAVVVPDDPNLVVAIPAILCFVGAILLAMKGWDWMSQYEIGTVGSAIKIFVLLMLPVTVIGALPICYWTGKGAARLAGHQA